MGHAGGYMKSSAFPQNFSRIFMLLPLSFKPHYPIHIFLLFFHLKTNNVSVQTHFVPSDESSFISNHTYTFSCPCNRCIQRFLFISILGPGYIGITTAGYSLPCDLCTVIAYASSSSSSCLNHISQYAHHQTLQSSAP